MFVKVLQWVRHQHQYKKFVFAFLKMLLYGLTIFRIPLHLNSNPRPNDYRESCYLHRWIHWIEWNFIKQSNNHNLLIISFNASQHQLVNFMKNKIATCETDVINTDSFPIVTKMLVNINCNRSFNFCNRLVLFIKKYLESLSLNNK